MDIKARIDALTEAEAKAALAWVLCDDALGRISVGAADVENTMENLLIRAFVENTMENLLNRALWEVQHGHKGTD